MTAIWRNTLIGAAAFAAWGLIAEGRGLIPEGQEPPRPLLDAPEPAEREMLPGVTADGLKISLTASRTEFQAGDIVVLSLVFENVSEAPLRVFVPIAQFAGDYIEVRATGPKVMRYSIQERSRMAWRPGLTAFPVLAPGETRKFTLPLTSNPPTIMPGGVILGAAGEYKIQVVYTYRGDGPDASGSAEPTGDARPPQQENVTPWRGRAVSEPITVKVGGDVQAPKPVMPIRPIHGLPPP